MSGGPKALSVRQCKCVKWVDLVKVRENKQWPSKPTGTGL